MYIYVYLCVCVGIKTPRSVRTCSKSLLCLLWWHTLFFGTHVRTVRNRLARTCLPFFFLLTTAVHWTLKTSLFIGLLHSAPFTFAVYIFIHLCVEIFHGRHPQPVPGSGGMPISCLCALHLSPPRTYTVDLCGVLFWGNSFNSNTLPVYSCLTAAHSGPEPPSSPCPSPCFSPCCAPHPTSSILWVSPVSPYRLILLAAFALGR